MHNNIEDQNSMHCKHLFAVLLPLTPLNGNLKPFELQNLLIHNGTDPPWLQCPKYSLQEEMITIPLSQILKEENFVHYCDSVCVMAGQVKPPKCNKTDYSGAIISYNEKKCFVLNVYY